MLTSINKITYLARGASGCVYTIEGGFKNPFTGQVENAVVKTPRLDRPDGIRDNEIEALQAVQSLFYRGFGIDDSRRWLVMKHLPGVKVYLHPLFTAKFPNGYNDIPEDPNATAEQIEAAYIDCSNFITALQRKVIDAIGHSIIEFGWDPVDLNMDNYLFTIADTLDQVTVNIVDWGMADRVSMKKADRYRDWKLRKRVIKRAFLADSSLTIDDNVVHEGICRSTMRYESYHTLSEGSQGTRDITSFSDDSDISFPNGVFAWI
ncbi:hypothetical protein FRB99_009023 [Tulasnella sp. 403]|nr:hypothetical protein FRB99_009023 [Tulasnella sp. 403]